MAGSALLSRVATLGQLSLACPRDLESQMGSPPDYTLTIAVKPVELAPNRILSTATYNGQFPGPLLRLKKISG
jgi:hypothetical protein